MLILVLLLPRRLPACRCLQVDSLEEADRRIDGLAASGALDPALLLMMAKAYAGTKDTDVTKEEVCACVCGWRAGAGWRAGGSCVLLCCCACGGTAAFAVPVCGGI